MKQFLAIAVLGSSLFSAFAAPASKAAPAVEQKISETIAVTADRIEAKCGEKITFNIKLSGANIADRKVIAEVSGNRKIRAKKLLTTDASGSAKIEVTSQVPGIVYCRAFIKGQSLKLAKAAGVAVEKEKVTPALPCPADFNDFWNKIKSELDARPMDAVVTPEPVKNKALKGFKVIFPMGGDGKDGYAKLSYPANAKPKSLPAFLLVHGAGTGFVALKEEWTTLGGGMLLLSLSPMPADSKGGVYHARQGRFAGYRHWNPDNRDKIFFKDMFSRVYRALQYLKSRPEWDGKTLIVYGVSQGGGQALAAGGLDPQITMVVAHVPAICHHGGDARGTESGWPHYQLTPAYKKNRQAVLNATAYFDGVNFARNIKTPRVLITTGFIDRTCPPESVFAAFNTIPSTNKKLICTPEATHRVPDPVRAIALKEVADHIKTGK
ncbi:MAG: acetylxylan esterase [Lentisphaeria bacterium]|nr:acetylxylan esterase [Lentisphaeria bacterium]